ncbi:MAG: 2-oxoacid:ferredoxin oxidoreductase subunit beta [Bacteroidetes bacterium]|nr:MAG: 2-oxoacid:ferredoxin oxidoreductase subunit beta [Bacteroidota bacterium]
MQTENIPEVHTYTSKDFASDQEVRWCPGCGDYSILKQVQTVLAELKVEPHNIAFISGIGCSSRFPYYMNTYGMHSIHGRAPAIASGLKITRPEIKTWVITGDGDALSIGGNHFIHILRRNFNVNILLFNNQIYGLTKGQYSPTSLEGQITKSSPYGVVDHQFNPVKLALGAEATFVARSMDRDPKHLRTILLQAEKHQGTSFVEIYQNCNIFNDGAFFTFTEKATKANTTVFLEHGQPLIFGENKNLGIKLDGYQPKVVDMEKENISADELWIHDIHDSIKADILANMFDTPKDKYDLPRPFGVFYQTRRTCYEDAVNEQVEKVKAKKGQGDLDALLSGNYTWTIE